MTVQRIELDEIAASEKEVEPALEFRVGLVKDVRVSLAAVLGTAELTVGELFGLGQDSVITLDRELNAPVDVLLGDRLIARGVLVAAGDKFGIQISEICQ